MSSTAIDYWKMVTDFNLSGIVTCSENFEEEVSSLIILDVIESWY